MLPLSCNYPHLDKEDHGRLLCSNPVNTQSINELIVIEKMTAFRCQNWSPAKVWPYLQDGGATFILVTVRPFPVVTMNERLCPFMLMLVCQFWPQLRHMGCHPVLEPLIFTASMLPSPPTFVMSTKTKNWCPFTVKCMPPDLLQETLLTDLDW